MRISIDIPCTSIEIDKLLSDRVTALPILADLVEPNHISAPHFYKKFNDLSAKELYREQLLTIFQNKWTTTKGSVEAQQNINKFKELASKLDQNGAFILGAIVNSENFQKLIESYTTILEGSGSKSWLHSYVNLGNHPDFLTNKEFNAAFMHPLLIALVSYQIGGPVRIVDARGKDAEPMNVLAQDNMLHIDNTPFNDEYKVILTWERGKPKGPKGQNFVFLPGTHKAARQCMLGNNGPWSSENASIFTTVESIEKVLQFQENTIGKKAIVELTHDTKPLTTLFAAGSLVHHRHRTEEGIARSCMIIAFHRSKDNPGSLIDQKYFQQSALKADSLFEHLLIKQVSDGSYLNALAEKIEEIEELMRNLSSEESQTEELIPSARELTEEEVKKWKAACTIAPTVEEKKGEAHIIPLGKTLTHDQFVQLVTNMMIYDKHGPLDLILYPDAHEEIRKWARNQIREKNLDLLAQQMHSTWAEYIEAPAITDLLTPLELQNISYELAFIAKEKLKNWDDYLILSSNEKISPSDALRSTYQLLLDLGESIIRCENRIAFLSTSLFIFWAADTLMRFESIEDSRIKTNGTKLLKNYIATAILAEKQRLSNIVS